jgi:hypothetical protein
MTFGESKLDWNLAPPEKRRHLPWLEQGGSIAAGAEKTRASRWFTMRQGSRRLGLLMAPWFLLVLQVSAQGTEPTLQDTMNFIASALNSRGTISWTETIPDVFGASYTMNSSLTDVNADSSACSLKWTSVYTSTDDKLVETYLVRLRTVSSVAMEPYSQYRKSDFQLKFEVSPETYVVVMKTEAPIAGNRELYHKNKSKSQTRLPKDREARLLFSDEKTANTVGDRIRNAAKICASTRSAP